MNFDNVIYFISVIVGVVFVVVTNKRYGLPQNPIYAVFAAIFILIFTAGCFSIVRVINKSDVNLFSTVEIKKHDNSCSSN